MSLNMHGEKRAARYILIYALFLIGLPACVVGQGNEVADTGMITEIISTETPVIVAQASTLTPTLPITPATPGPTTLMIWWPDSLSTPNNTDAAVVLSSQIEAFQTAQGNAIVEMRLKREEDLGGIMPTLRTAIAVAPGALPDLTLIRRDDLLDAVQSGLIYPLEGGVASAVLGDLYDVALQLGQVDGQLYGLPYVLDAQHVAYLSAGQGELSWRFEDILAANRSFIFPAANANGVNSIFLMQYLAAGGTLPVDGVMTIDESALVNSLAFYEQAVAAGLINPSVLNYTTPAEYQTDLVSGVMDAGVVTTHSFLDLTQSGENLGFGPIPTESGAVVGQVDGWMWVLTTSSADRQALSVRFLNWMLNANRQGEYSRAINLLPSQRSALTLWEQTPYTEFANTLLTNGMPPLSDSAGGTAARALQNALTSVLLGQNTARQAAQAVMDQLENQ